MAKKRISPEYVYEALQEINLQYYDLLLQDNSYLVRNVLQALIGFRCENYTDGTWFIEYGDFKLLDEDYVNKLTAEEVNLDESVEKASAKFVKAAIAREVNIIMKALGNCSL